MSTAYEDGWNAYYNNVPFDITKSQEWRNGWVAAEHAHHKEYVHG